MSTNKFFKWEYSFFSALNRILIFYTALRSDVIESRHPNRDVFATRKIRPRYGFRTGALLMNDRGETLITFPGKISYASSWRTRSSSSSSSSSFASPSQRFRVTAVRAKTFLFIRRNGPHLHATAGYFKIAGRDVTIVCPSSTLRARGSECEFWHLFKNKNAANDYLDTR